MLSPVSINSAPVLGLFCSASLSSLAVVPLSPSVTALFSVFASSETSMLSSPVTASFGFVTVSVVGFDGNLVLGSVVVGFVTVSVVGSVGNSVLGSVGLVVSSYLAEQSLQI